MTDPRSEGTRVRWRPNYLRAARDDIEQYRMGNGDKYLADAIEQVITHIERDERDLHNATLAAPELPVQGPWHVAGHSNYRTCNCTDGQHRRRVPAEEVCAYLNTHLSPTPPDGQATLLVEAQTAWIKDAGDYMTGFYSKLPKRQRLWMSGMAELVARYAALDAAQQGGSQP